MTQPIENVVLVNIDRQTRVVSQKGFGTPLVASVHTLFAESIKFVNGLTALTEMLGFGYTTSDVAYKQVQAIVAQSPRVEKIALGKLPTNVAGEFLVSFSTVFVAGNVVNMDVNGVAITPVTFNTDQATTMAALELAIEAVPGVVSATSAGSTITILFALGVAPTVANVEVTGGAGQPTVVITNPTIAVTVATGLDAIAAESDDWYGFCLESTLENDQLGAAAWAETFQSQKLYSARSAQAGALATTQLDIGALLKAKNYERSFVSYHNVANEYIDAAILGKLLPFEPGSVTAKFKTLAGITADNLSQNAITNLQNKNINHVVKTGGLDIYQEGKVAVGEFIDVIIGVDWIKSRMQEGVFSVLANAPKIAYADAGVKKIETEVRNIILQAVQRNILSEFPQYTLVIPKVASQSTTDRANRFFPGIVWQASLAGAIHKVRINGTVSV